MEKLSKLMSYLNAPENEGVIREVTRETYLRALKEHQESIGELWNANEECWHKLDPTESSGIRCVRCGGGIVTKGEVRIKGGNYIESKLITRRNYERNRVYRLPRR